MEFQHAAKFLRVAQKLLRANRLPANEETRCNRPSDGIAFLSLYYQTGRNDETVSRPLAPVWKQKHPRSRPSP